MTTAPVLVSHIVPSPCLTVTQFNTLEKIPPKFEWFANLAKANPRQAYRQDIKDYQTSACLHRPEQFPDVTSAHVITWRQRLTRQGLVNDTIRRQLVELSSL